MVHDFIIKQVLNCLSQKGCLKCSIEECYRELKFYGFINNAFEEDANKLHEIANRLQGYGVLKETELKK